MNQSKFSLADLLIVLGALCFGFFCFLSLNFLTLGDTTTSMIGAVVISFVLGGLAFGLKLLKRTSRNFKTCIIFESFLIILFLVVSFLAIMPFSHFFVVSAQQESIKFKVLSSIVQAEGLFTDYETYANKRLNIHRNNLMSVVYAKALNPLDYKNYGFIDGIDDNRQVYNEILSLKFQLYPTNYSQMKQIDSVWLADAKDKVTSWSPLGIVKVVNTLNAEVLSWNQQLKSYSSFRARKGEEGYPVFDSAAKLTFDDVSGIFTKRSTPNTVALIFGIGTYLLMMLSYFITKRHPRFPGLRVVFGTGGNKENEL